MSRNIALSVRRLSKSYTIAHRREQHSTLAERLLNKILTRGRADAAAEEFWALRDVSFDVHEGEVVGVIGRNGAGKSTLLKILSLITEPTGGQIDIFGRVGSLLEVGTGFHPELTGRENIYLNGQILGMRKREIDWHFDGIVEFAGVERFLDTPVKRYSSGMYVRLAFAVAAHLSADILLVDEVLAVGDAEFQRRCLDTMHDVARDGRTVLFVSHNMAAVRGLCNRAILLEDGKVAMVGDTDEVTRRYALREEAEQGRAIDFVRTLTEGVGVETVTVNGSASMSHMIPSSVCLLEIAVEGILANGARLDLEARILDGAGLPLVFCSPGHQRGRPHHVTAGRFTLTCVLELPRLNQGIYLLALSLTQPGVETYAELTSPIRLQVEGEPTATGHVFQYDRGAGFLFARAESRVHSLSTVHGRD